MEISSEFEENFHPFSEILFQIMECQIPKKNVSHILLFRFPFKKISFRWKKN